MRRDADGDACMCGGDGAHYQLVAVTAASRSVRDEVFKVGGVDGVETSASEDGIVAGAAPYDIVMAAGVHPVIARAGVRPPHPGTAQDDVIPFHTRGLRPPLRPQTRRAGLACVQGYFLQPVATRHRRLL